MEKKAGIYIIFSITKPERFYIGSAVNLRRRKEIHITDLNADKHHSKKLQNHFNKYGRQDLIFEPLELVENKENLLEREQVYLNQFQPYFNICKTAGSSFGVVRSEESRKKMSIAKKGKKMGEDNPNYGKRMFGENNPFFGKHHTKETIEKILNTKKQNNYVVSEETKKKISDSQKGRKAWNEGIIGVFHHSEETKNIISEKNIGIPKSEEHKEKISNTLTGKLVGEKNPFWGRKHSEESLKKMSESKKGQRLGIKQSEEWIRNRIEKGMETKRMNKLCKELQIGNYK